MTRQRSDNVTITSPEPPQPEITLEGLEFLDGAVIQAEIGLVEHYFHDLLKDLFTKGQPPP